MPRKTMKLNLEIKLQDDFQLVDGGYCLIGSALINGCSHIVQLERVEVDESGQYVQNTDQLFTKLQEMYDGNYLTVEVPGFPGDWALFITPHPRDA